MENLNEDGKAKIIEFANLLRASRKYLPHRADIIPFENYQPIAVEPASAGTGNFDHKFTTFTTNLTLLYNTRQND